jgi:NAD(P)-dependent dehydrogenase (short-subunit alcohol dehydrogenase family)
MDRLACRLLDRVVEAKLVNARLRRKCNCGAKVAVVLGGSSGIGKGIVEKIASKGWIVVAVAREGTRLWNTARTINSTIQSKGLVLPCAADATQTAATVDAIQAVLAKIDNTAVVIDSLVMAHGFFAWDKDILAKQLLTANYESKHLVLSSMAAHGFVNEATSVIVIGSQAGAPGFKEEMVCMFALFFHVLHIPHCVATSQEAKEGAGAVDDELLYIECMQQVHTWAADKDRLEVKTSSNGSIKVKVSLFEPGLVDTPMVRREFAHFGIEWSGIPKPSDFAEEVWPAVSYRESRPLCA